MANFDSQCSNHQLKTISKCFVKPQYQVEASKKPYYLNPVDLKFLTLDPIQKGLLFPNKPNDMQVDFLEKLKESLALALVHFYPLAGQLSTKEFPEENTNCVYLDCNKGPGALFIHAIVDYSMSDILSSVDVHPIVQSFFDLGEKSINYDGHTRPLLTLQVTELTDAIFVGFNINHSVIDGNSEWHFINSLSKIFLQLSNNNQQNNLVPTISKYPVFKPYFPDGYGPILKLHKDFLNACMTQPNNQIILRERMFHFSSKSISELKAKANFQCEVHNISSFQALSAFMWMSITRARNLQPEAETCYGLIMDTRSRCSPALTSDYFGNYLMRQQKICTVGELLNNGLGWASMLAHQLVASQDEKKVCEFYEMMIKFLCEDPSMSLPCYYNPNPILIGGSMRFEMYGPEFGLGKAVVVLAGFSGKADGKITVNPGRDNDGSVDLEVCLKPEIMSALESDENFMSFVSLV